MPTDLGKMHRQKWIIFYLAASLQLGHSQIVDDFSMSSDQIATFWNGDRDHYVINSDKELQLNATTSGASQLYAITQWQLEMSWEMYVRLDFDPSLNNRLEIYLWSDTTAINEGDAMLISIGQNGQDDALTLIRQEDGDRSTIASGSMGAVARGPVELRLKIYVEEGFLVVSADHEGGDCFVPEIEIPITELDIGNPMIFGWEATYTSTRKDRFYLDDIYAGSLRLDTLAPSVIDISSDPTEIKVAFSESMRTETFSESQVVLIPDASDKSVSLSKEGLLSIKSSIGFNRSKYQLVLTDLQDLAGNSLDTTLSFEVACQPDAGDLLINEILFNPRGSGADYVEIFNASGKILSLSNVILSNTQNGDEVSLEGLPDLGIAEVVALTDDVENIIESYPTNDSNRILPRDIPRLNNDEGNVTLSIGETILDAFDYHEELHHPLLDDVNGISLERISPQNSTNEPDNWVSGARETGFGTPGLRNSAFRTLLSSENRVSINERIFSPNGDGQKDEATILYQFATPGYVGTVRVYNDRGQLIKTLLNNEIMSTGGLITWDGRDQSASIAPIGIYIVQLQFFNLEGDSFNKRLSVGLGDFLD